MARPPEKLNDFIGQARLRRHLNRLVDGSLSRGIVPPPLLFVARSGQGKSALAAALARKYAGEEWDEPASSFHYIIGGSGLTRIVPEKLRVVRYGDFLFMDEAHAMERDIQEMLFLVLDQWKTYQIDEKGRLDRSAFDSVAEFCLILATAEPSLVLPALRNRLEVLEFDPYTVPELKAIAELVATQDGLKITPQAARYLAEHCQGSPRQIRRAVDLLKTYYPEAFDFTQEHVREFLNGCGIDDHGLHPKQREYLQVLASNPQGVASLERIGSKIGFDFPYLRREVEPYMLERGLIEISTARSRMITGAGRQIVQELAVSEEETTP